MQKEARKKIAYVRPEVLDLGPAATIQGSICATGFFNVGDCASGTGASTCPTGDAATTLVAPAAAPRRP